VTSKFDIERNNTDADLCNNYDVYGNLFHPLEEALVESYVKVALGVEKDNNLTLWEVY
jgi:hypothetical protein